MPDDDLLTTTEVATMLHRSTRTVLRHVAEGRLPYARRLGEGPNAAYLFKRADLDYFRAAGAA